MSGPRSRQRDNLLLIAATAIMFLAAQRYFWASRRGTSPDLGDVTATRPMLAGRGDGLMMWMWMSAVIVLCGAEPNSEIEHRTALDTTIGGPEPLGVRGAVMADTLGPAASARSKEH